MDMTLPREIHRVFSAAEEQPIDWLGEKRFSQFDVEYDTPNNVLIPGRVVAYSVSGTAFGETRVQH